jgi:hydroxymethylbilane synthase
LIDSVKLGTRGSALALTQTNEVVDCLHAAHPQLDVTVTIISTHGDQRTDVPLTDFGTVGAFTSTLETQLKAGIIDLAVHSYKDLPTQITPGTIVGAAPFRRNPADVLISRKGYTLETLPQGAKVGTCSSRRTAQLLHHRPDLHILDVRGNVDTRINKALAQDGMYDAIMLAYAGLERLGRLDVISQILPFEIMLPAPAQAALAVQCRDDHEWRTLLQPVNDPVVECAVAAERAFLSTLEAGCALPVAAYALVDATTMTLHGRVISPDGKQKIDVTGSAPLEGVESAQHLGTQLADEAKAQGAFEVLESIR